MSYGTASFLEAVHLQGYFVEPSLLEMTSQTTRSAVESEKRLLISTVCNPDGKIWQSITDIGSGLYFEQTTTVGNSGWVVYAKSNPAELAYLAPDEPIERHLIPTRRNIGDAGEVISPMQRAACLIVNDFSALQSKWDGTDMIAPSMETISRAIALIKGLPAEYLVPKPRASGEGEVSLTWRGPGGEVEAIIYPEGDLTYIAVRDGVVIPGNEIRWMDEDSVPDGLARFIRDKTA